MTRLERIDVLLELTRPLLGDIPYSTLIFSKRTGAYIWGVGLEYKLKGASVILYFSQNVHFNRLKLLDSKRRKVC